MCYNLNTTPQHTVTAPKLSNAAPQYGPASSQSQRSRAVFAFGLKPSKVLLLHGLAAIRRWPGATY